MKNDEHKLENECKIIARKHGCLVWKNHPDGLKGIPDLSVLTNKGVFMFVELKTTHGKLSPEQKTWRETFPNIFHIIRNTQEFEQLILENIR